MDGYEVRHHIMFGDGVGWQVEDCEDAHKAAGDNGFGHSAQNDEWWIEVHHWKDGQPVAGAEWDCGCDLIRFCDMGCGYRLPDEYKWWDSTCGACLNLQAITIEQETM
jgi:hypothetical protein